ncbi:MAG: hypothetical protein HY735_13030 [Verrucomicrobia bacterium]|nr:hypothetical protein [Verrucomicrobiota bacterium]
MNKKRIKETILRIYTQPCFPFTVFDVEEDLQVILAHYGVREEFGLDEEFALKKALLPLALDATTNERRRKRAKSANS